LGADEPRFARLVIGQSLSAPGNRMSFVARPFAVLPVGGSASHSVWRLRHPVLAGLKVDRLGDAAPPPAHR
jgi:hypothetical protein